MTDAPCWHVDDLRKRFPIQRGLLHRALVELRAVDGVSFDGARRRNACASWVNRGAANPPSGELILRLMEPSGGAYRHRGYRHYLA